MKRKLLYLVAALMFFGCSACHKRYIENTKIPDTDDNRMILDLLETYRAAMEERDAEKLVSLCSQSYFEDMATVNKDDDFTLEEFKNKVVPEIFSHTDELYINIIVDEVETKKDRGHVDFRFDYRAHLVFPSGSKWINDASINRFKLVKIDGKWLVSDGL